MKGVVGLATAVLVSGALAQAPSDFAWRGRVEVPREASLVRAQLPAQAMLRLQSAQANDVRVFDGNGQPVPFALAEPPQAAAGAREPTRRFPALPLYGKQTAAAGQGAIEVRVNDGGAQRSVWVNITPAGTSDAQRSGDRLPSVLIDTRAEKRAINALVVHGQLPPNRPVEIRVSTSTDLAQWTPAPVRSRLYRFDGDNAPANDTLELGAPLQLEDRYLRLEWQGEQGVTVSGVTGLVAPPAPKPTRVAATLPAPRADGPAALEWELGFATPLAALELSTQQSNTLVPVRILGRSKVSEPWQLLGRTVVWRLGHPGSDHVNPAAPLQRPSVRWLRVEATHGMRLEGIPLTAQVVFDPVQLVFVAGGQGPFEVAAGRAETSAAALPLTMLMATTQHKLEELTAVTITPLTDAPPRPRGPLAQWLPRGVEPRTVLLWLVLGGGVLVLGGVAWSLLRQINRKGGGTQD
jgi:hypothetical protein